MTYYEEFGVSSSATPEEIRQSHRRLIKILHPDLQNEEGTRQLAEIQTRRLNCIAQILLDGKQRNEYDTSLLPTSPMPQKYRVSTTNLVFAATAGCVLVVIWIFLADAVLITRPVPSEPLPTASSPEAHVEGARERQRSTTASGAVREVSRTTEQRRVEAARITPPVKPEPIARENGPEPLSTEPLPSAKPALSADPEHQPQKAAAQTASTVTDSPLIGTWIYVPAPAAGEDSKMYRPEYIEMRIRNFRGEIEGQYRARYHVPDRPLSPSVGFHFAGASSISSTTFRWRESSGLAGQVELKLMNTNSIQVNWRVTELAETADLVSGTAVLTRVQ